MDNTTAINVALIDPHAGSFDTPLYSKSGSELTETISGDQVYLGPQVLGQILAAISSHNPGVILVSLGFDAAQGDDEGFTLSSSGYGKIITEISRAAGSLCRVFIALEGGYKPDLIKAGVEAVAFGLLEGS